MLLFYVRHGEPIYNPDSLTEQGQKQARALVDRLLNAQIDKVYSSTSNRAKLTAQPFCEKVNKTPVLLDWANEGYAYEELAIEVEGKKTWAYRFPFVKKLFNDPKIIAMGNDWGKAKEFSCYNFDSGVKRVRKETTEWLKTLGLNYDSEKRVYIKTEKFENKNVALFAHAGFGLLFLSTLLEIPYPVFSNRFMELGYSSMTVISFDETEEEIIPKIVEYSNDSHLFKSGLKPYHYYKEF